MGRNKLIENTLIPIPSKVFAILSKAVALMFMGKI
jgi:hypothetical protein